MRQSFSSGVTTNQPDVQVTPRKLSVTRLQNQVSPVRVTREGPVIQNAVGPGSHGWQEAEMGV